MVAGRRNVECLAWWEGRQKGEKEGERKKSVLTSVCEGFQSLPSGCSTSRWVLGCKCKEVANASQAATKELL